MERLRQTYERNREILIFSLIATFLWGMLAHGYGFMHSSFSHDSLNEFNAANGGDSWKIQLGRYVIPLYRAVFRTQLTLPWLVGMLSLIWIGLAVYFVVRIFNMQSKLIIFVTAGIFTTNITVAATAATYMHDYDCNMFAMLCAVAAVFLWKRYSWGFFLGAVLLAVSLGIYQSYLSVAIVLIMFVCILKLLDETEFQHVLTVGMKGIGMILIGGILYYIGLQIVLAVTKIPLSSGDYNSLDKVLDVSVGGLPSLILYTYIDCFWRFWNAVSPYPTALVRTVFLLLTGMTAIAVLFGITDKRGRRLEKLLCAGLVILIPFGMNITYVLVAGVVHDLMVYAVWLFYLFALLMADWLVKHKANNGGKILRIACLVLTLVQLYGNVQVANAMYLKKDLEQDAFLSLMTRVVYEMEEYDHYEPGETPVVFVGLSEQMDDVISGFEKYRTITGMEQARMSDTRVNYRMQRYFDYVLSNPAVMADDAVWTSIQKAEEVLKMPCYPDDGCITMIDDVLVVKLG